MRIELDRAKHDLNERNAQVAQLQQDLCKTQLQLAAVEKQLEAAMSRVKEMYKIDEELREKIDKLIGIKALHFNYNRLIVITVRLNR